MYVTEILCMQHDHISWAYEAKAYYLAFYYDATCN